MMQCPACDQTIRVGSRLCPSCGVWLVDSAGQPVRPLTVPTATVPPMAGPSVRVIIPPTADLGSYGPPAAAQRVQQPAPAGERESMYPLAEEFDEVTTLSARRKKPSYWTITLPNGDVELVTDRVVIGRHPEYMPALPTARLIAVSDPSRSVSKNHACFSLYRGDLVVEDLGSTNGIIVTRPDGHEHDIGVGGRVELEDGAKVELGDVVVYIGRR